MSANAKDRNTPQSVYYYVQGLLKVQDTDDLSQIKKQCVGVCYNYLNSKKLQWSIYLQNLMKLFLDLAFETQKYSKIKQILKQYRNLTQNQHPDSLKTILDYYRDQKLQQILSDQILNQNIDYIRKIKNIQQDQVSSQIILSSFNLQAKSKKQWIRTNLKIVWQGYKAIADTIRLNHKMQAVNLATLKNVFTFVQKYNRKEQFKSFCQNQRRFFNSNILSPRKDKKDAQKTYHIDIQKQDINTSYIQIRFQQFDLAAKLGLWKQAQQTLSDIVAIMRVKKGPVKNILKSTYFQKLAFFWANAKCWHYHAYAFFNYYSIYITKSKLAATDKIKMADKLILSVLCIPPSSLQRFASKQKNQKTSLIMMIPTNKILEKHQLQQFMISKGVVENASPAIRQLWYFMFLEFDLTSLTKGLKLLQNIKKQDQYKQFIGLLQQILIYKQLISVAQVYQKMKYQSLMAIIPFPKQKIQRVLLECHHRKVIDFVLDKRQGLIIFQDQLQQTNPYQQFLSCYVDIALLHQQGRKHDKQFIIKKAKQFMSTADDYYNNVRNYKIQQYKKKLKKPRQELQQKQRQKQKKLQEQRKQQQALRRQKQLDEKKEQQQKLKLFIQKKVRIDQIIKTKQNRIVKIGDKRIQNLTDQQIKQMDKQIFQQGLRQITARVAADNQNRNKKRFLKIDYNQRQRRQQIKQIMIKQIPEQQKQKQYFNKLVQLSKTNYDQKQNLKAQIEKVAPQVKTKINQYYDQSKQKYEQNMKKFKESIADQFKKKVINRARQLIEQAEKKKVQDELRRRSEQIKQSQDSWSFGKKLVSNAVDNTDWKRKEKTTQTGQTQTTTTTKQTTFKKNTSNESWGRKGPISGITQSNAFSSLKVDEQQKKQQRKQKWGKKEVQQKKEQKKQQKQQKGWLGTKKTQTQNKTVQPQKKQEKQPNKFVPPTVEQPKGAWGKGKTNTTNTTTNNVNVNVNNNTKTQAQKRDEPQLTFKGGAKKDDKKPGTKGRGW